MYGEHHFQHSNTGHESYGPLYTSIIVWWDQSSGEMRNDKTTASSPIEISINKRLVYTLS